MHVHSGDRIEFIKVDNERYEIIAVTKDIHELKGMVKTNQSVTIEEMNNSIAMMGKLP